MGKNCIYCSMVIPSDSVVDMCEGCMFQVWGEKMTKAILAGMEKEKDKGNLELGRVSEDPKIGRESEIEKVMEVSDELAEELEEIEEEKIAPEIDTGFVPPASDDLFVL